MDPAEKPSQPDNFMEHKRIKEKLFAGESLTEPEQAFLDEGNALIEKQKEKDMNRYDNSPIETRAMKHGAAANEHKQQKTLGKDYD